MGQLSRLSGSICIENDVNWLKLGGEMVVVQGRRRDLLILTRSSDP